MSFFRLNSQIYVISLEGGGIFLMAQDGINVKYDPSFSPYGLLNTLTFRANRTSTIICLQNIVFSEMTTAGRTH